jgi:hypothetical protein
MIEKDVDSVRLQRFPLDARCVIALEAGHSVQVNSGSLGDFLTKTPKG